MRILKFEAVKHHDPKKDNEWDDSPRNTVLTLRAKLDDGSEYLFDSDSLSSDEILKALISKLSIDFSDYGRLIRCKLLMSEYYHKFLPRGNKRPTETLVLEHYSSCLPNHDGSITIKKYGLSNAHHWQELHATIKHGYAIGPEENHIFKFHYHTHMKQAELIEGVVTELVKYLSNRNPEFSPSIELAPAYWRKRLTEFVECWTYG